MYLYTSVHDCVFSVRGILWFIMSEPYSLMDHECAWWLPGLLLEAWKWQALDSPGLAVTGTETRLMIEIRHGRLCVYVYVNMCVCIFYVHTLYCHELQVLVCKAIQKKTIVPLRHGLSLLMMSDCLPVGSDCLPGGSDCLTVCLPGLTV